MTIKAIPATEENFEPYGEFVRLIQGEGRTGDGGWHAWLTQNPCLDVPVMVGYCLVGGSPFEVDTMESSVNVEEVLICGDKPMVLPVAATDPGEPVKAEDVRAFIISPGEYVRIKKSLWHDACRSVDGEGCYYYFLSAQPDDSNVLPLTGDPVTVEV